MNLLISLSIIGTALICAVFLFRWLDSPSKSAKLDRVLFEVLEKEPMTIVQLYRGLKYKYPAEDLRRALDYNPLFKCKNGTWALADAPESNIGES
jgi:hypothetical protein